MRQSSWNEVLLEVRAVPDLLLLQVDREQLHLPQQKAGERRARVRGSRQIAEQVGERERPRRRGRLHDVQPLPPQVAAHLESVPALQPGERVGNLRHAGSEIRGRADRRAQLRVAGDGERRQRVRKLGVGRNAGQPQDGRCRAAQLCGVPVNGAPGVAESKLVEHVARERALIAGGKRRRRGVLRPEGPGGRAAAVRQRRHRDRTASSNRVRRPNT